MALFTWSDKYRVNVESIDLQHMKLFQIANRLHDLFLQEGAIGREKFGDILDSLVQYTKAHFAFEEKVLKESNFPDYDEHLAEHKNLVNDLNTYVEKYKAGGDIDTLNLLNFTIEWLQDHILGTDMEYSRFLNSQETDTDSDFIQMK